MAAPEDSERDHLRGSGEHKYEFANHTRWSFCDYFWALRNRLVPARTCRRGSPITPAGTLLIDAATHLPAVGAMPMAMLRSPDSLGRGGKGRYLLVVNSGFGVQFSEETNRASNRSP